MLATRECHSRMKSPLQSNCQSVLIGVVSLKSLTRQIAIKVGIAGLLGEGVIDRSRRSFFRAQSLVLCFRSGRRKVRKGYWRGLSWRRWSLFCGEQRAIPGIFRSWSVEERPWKRFLRSGSRKSWIRHGLEMCLRSIAPPGQWW